MSLLDSLGLNKIDSKYVIMLESLTEKNTKGKGIHPYGEKFNPDKEEKKFIKAKQQKIKEGAIVWKHFNYDKLSNEYFYA